MHILSLSPGEYPISGFRIFVEQAGFDIDVRLSERAVLYVGAPTPEPDPVDNPAVPAPTVYDRADDRTFD